jgi:threonine aldolase
MPIAKEKFFANDHAVPVHDEVMASMIRANEGIQASYAGDEITRGAEDLFRKTFGENARTFFVGSGTAANVLALYSLTPAVGSIYASAEAHLAKDEAGAPEFFTRAKVRELPAEHAKIKPEQLDPYMYQAGSPHYSRPTILSISQPTERGTVYTVDEITALVDKAHDNNMFVHMDGARIFHAANRLGVDVKDFTTDLGVDVVTVGGAKVGGLGFGEAVVFLNPELELDFTHDRKQLLQLISKTRIPASQWEALLKAEEGEANLAMRLAGTANDRMQELAEKVSGAPQVKISDPVETNGLWVVFEQPKHIETLEESGYVFARWNAPENNEIRFMTTHVTPREAVQALARDIKALK